MVAPGQFVLYSHVIPDLPAGNYTIDVAQDITAPNAGAETLRAHLEVTAPRFGLPASQLLSTFPPNQGQGAFSTRLPQVVLLDRMLPWEREVMPGAPARIPWLALVTLADGECQFKGGVPVAQCVTAGVTLTGPSDAATGDCVVVTQDVVNQVFPTKSELPLLAHVRQVDMYDTELNIGGGDGWLSVVLSSRLPQPGVRYRACLISLEGQYDVLPDSAEEAQGFKGTHVYPDAIPKLGGYAFASGGVAAARSLTVADAWSAPGGARAVEAVRAAPAGIIGPLAGAMNGVSMDLIAPNVPQYTFPVLATWQFTCSGAGDFRSLMEGLDVGMLGTVPQPPPAPAPGQKPPPPAGPPPEALDTGHIALRHVSRAGQAGLAWYRGPLAARPMDREQPGPDGTLPLLHSSDQARRVGPDGRENLSLAAAFEIGRLLALADPSIVAALLSWRKDGFDEARRQVLISQEPTLSLLGTTDIGAGFGGRAGGSLVTGLGADGAVRLGAVRLGPVRPLTDPGRPAAGVDDADRVTLLSAGLGVPAEVVSRLLGPSGERVPLQVPVGAQTAGLDALAAAAATELAGLRAASYGAAAAITADLPREG